MRKLILAGTLLLIPSLASAGFVFAAPKKEPYIQPGSPRARAYVSTTKRAAGSPKQCDPSYPTICVQPGAQRLTCRDIGFANFPVVGRDPYGFDRDHNGVGCEARVHH